MDLAGTTAIVADVAAWLSGGWLDGTSTVGMGATLQSQGRTKYGSRAGRPGGDDSVRTYVQDVPAVRPHAENAERRYSKGKKERDERGSDAIILSRMARDLRDAVSKNVAVIVILTVFAASLLAWNDSDTHTRGVPRFHHRRGGRCRRRR